jgi:hypothetical protein
MAFSFSFLLPRLTIVVGGIFVSYLSSSFVLTEAIHVGDDIPSGLSLHFGFPPQEISLDEHLKNKNVLLM